MTQPAATADAQLERALGVRQLSAAIFNYTVGSGIFALPAVAVANLGAAAPLAYVVCMVIMALVLLCFAEAGSRVSITGGPYAYVEVALGPFIGFIAGVMLLLTGTTAGAAVAVIFAKSVTALIPDAPTWLATSIVIATIALLVVANIRGVRNSARVIEGITIAKIVPLIGFVVVGIFFIDTDNFAWSETPSLTQVLSTAGIVIFAFSGIESALTPSGEVKNPSRTVPLASFIALAAATVLYLLIQGVALGIEGLALGNEKVTPLANAAQSFAGPIGKTILIVGASISMLGYLSANILSVPRSWFALGRDGFLPAALSAVHSRFHSPHIAIVLHGIVIGALALSGTFEQLAVFANLTAFALYLLCAIAVWVLRQRDVRSDGAPFLMPGGPLIPIATALVSAGMIWATAGVQDLVGLALATTAALAFYGVRAMRRRAP
ncbi:MAG TPA: APC family permease [Steroidobacteraceae bacterium]|nr:APC family permease [Steroidobacteraceae bacterium]